jgi:bifunctional non-homologous end joining protein LigD
VPTRGAQTSIEISGGPAGGDGQSRASETVAYDDNGVALFNRVRHRQHDESIFLYAFDLIELNCDDLRRDPLEGRRATLEIILAKAGPGIRFNEHMEGEGETVFRHACKLRLEGMSAKRKDSAYRSGRSPDWLKMKNADAPAVKREEEGTMGQKKTVITCLSANHSGTPWDIEVYACYRATSREVL